MKNYALSFAITTYNRRDFLVQAMSRVLDARKSDEEIVVVDGGSTDGTVEYLEKLRGDGKIDVFLSEPDRGQGHGINKAILRSSGELIKPINDDDVYDYESIAEARRYMQATPAVDVLCSTIQIVVWEPQPHLIRHSVFDNDSLFPRRNRSFVFGDLGMLLRRNSLSLLGLFSPEIAWIDYEYSMRITSTRAVVACMDRTTGLRLTNDTSKSVRLGWTLYDERQRIDTYYSNGWKPNSIMDRLRMVKAGFASFTRRLFLPKPDRNAPPVQTHCPSADVAFKIGEELMSTSRQQEPASRFRTSERA